ncbi:MAG: hypothetical protein GC160_08000 [Acidobacteria bacterium]|nr:hypothetical protein [Acidobacteriota bacterium]
MGFWRQPGSARWRHWAFRIHLWTGLLLGAWASLMGLSGAALVYKDEIAAALEPAVRRVEPGERVQGLDEALAEVRRRNPNHEIGGVIGLHRERESAYAWIGRTNERRQFVDRFNVHFNQYTGQVLGVEPRDVGLFGWLEELHFHLLLGQQGSRINGSLAAGLFAMCLTGLVIWWPGRERWADGLLIRWRSRWKRLRFDLHRAVGFYAAGALAVMAFTGGYFGFPQDYWKALTWLTGEKFEDFQAALAFPKSTVVEGGQATSVQEVYRRGAALLPAGFVVDGIILPRGREAVFNVRARRRGNPVVAGYFGSYFDQYSGELLGTVGLEDQPLALRVAQMLSPIHFGLWGGAWSKALWLALGLTPATLWLTGLWMWLDRTVKNRSAALRE